MKKGLALLTVLVLLLTAIPAFAETATMAEATPVLALTEATATDATAAEVPAEEEDDATKLSTASKIVVAVLVVLMLVGLYFSTKRVKWNAFMIAKAALCIALAYLLGMIRMYRAPMGGSATLASLLPLILFALAFGPLEGLLAGFTFGLLNLLLDPYVIHPIQMLVDYPMAYGAVALCCVAKLIPVSDRWRLPIAVVLGYLGKFCMAVISGVVFFANNAAEEGALVYSLVYNFSYIWPELLISLAISLVPGMDRLLQLMRKNSVR